mmetsp:Transcript_43044/g.116095  ORF Transcript_43044/g.116095 Transcript_43044/m.116095 type:complete len:620 (+) Transcript_43044:408-2267(+)
MLADDMAEQQHYSDIREAKEATCKELQEEMEQLQVQLTEAKSAVATKKGQLEEANANNNIELRLIEERQAHKAELVEKAEKLEYQVKKLEKLLIAAGGGKDGKLDLDAAAADQREIETDQEFLDDAYPDMDVKVFRKMLKEERKPVNDEFVFMCCFHVYPEWGEDGPDSNGFYPLHLLCRHRAASVQVTPELMYLAMHANKKAASHVDHIYGMTALHMFCYYSRTLVDKTIGYIIDAERLAAEEPDYGDNLPLHRVFMNTHSQLKVAPRAVRRLIHAYPPAVHHYREDDGKNPLHLLCSNKIFIQNHDSADVASIITMIRHGNMSEGDPAEAKDRSQRTPKEYLLRMAQNSRGMLFLDEVILKALTNEIVEVRQTGYVPPQSLSIGDMRAAAASLANLIDVEDLQIAQAVARSGGAAQGAVKLKKELKRLTKEVVPRLTKKHAEVVAERYKLEREIEQMSPIAKILHAHIKAHAPESKCDDVRSVKIMRSQIAEGLGKPAMEAWRKTQTTARNETNSKLRGQQVPATNTCFYGSSNKESDAIPHGMGTERFFIPDDEEPAVHNPPRFDDDYLDKMGVKKYHWEMTEDAMRHSIVPGHYMRWKNAGMDRFGRAQGANKLS